MSFKARLIPGDSLTKLTLNLAESMSNEFWYVIKSSNKSAQIPLQPTIQHSWAPQANYDEVIISAKGSTPDGSFCIM